MALFMCSSKEDTKTTRKLLRFVTYVVHSFHI